MNEAQLASFLVQAKRATYAAQGDTASVTSLVPGATQLEYALGDFLYRDIYFGFAYFVGQETVYEAGAPIWAMGYAGGMTDTGAERDAGAERNAGAGRDAGADVNAVYKFLRSALRQIESASPFRGPGLIRGDGFQYTSQTTGTLENFSGIERISSNRAIIYELRYHGGSLR